MTQLVDLKRALISVSDKTGLLELGKALADRGVELLSTGGSAKALRDAGLSVTDVADVTGFPEMMDGRVKTLHPNVHGGLLALRDNAEHLAAMQEHGIAGIDLLVVNLYPFEATVAKGADYDTAIENIDIGGPAMIRAAAKNHGFVAVVTDTEDYDALLQELDANAGATGYRFRQKLALNAYARTAAYDPLFQIGLRRLWMSPPGAKRLQAHWHKRCVMAKILTNPRPSTPTAKPVRASPPPFNIRAKNSPTTISMTPMRPWNWWPNLILKMARPASSLNMPTPAGSAKLRALWKHIKPPSNVIKPVLLVASSRSTKL